MSMPYPEVSRRGERVRRRENAIAKVVLSTYIEPSQKAALETLSRSTRVPVAEYIREAVDLVLARYAHLVRAPAAGGNVPAKSGPGRGGRRRGGRHG